MQLCPSCRIRKPMSATAASRLPEEHKRAGIDRWCHRCYTTHNPAEAPPVSSQGLTTMRGYLGANPIVRQREGKSFLTFRLSVRDRWWDCISYDQQAISAGEKLRQGDYVKVTGRITAEYIPGDRVGFRAQHDRVLQLGMNCSRIERLKTLAT